MSTRGRYLALAALVAACSCRAGKARLQFDASWAGWPDGPAAADDSGERKDFRFVSWADTKNATATLAALSHQAAAMGPQFTLFEGDLAPSGFNATDANIWKAAINGGASNALFDITFPVRGNHDDPGIPAWQAFFDLAAVAKRVGASHFIAKDEDLTYSFDYANAHFVGVDVPGDVTAITPSQLAWLDQDLTAAEGRELSHAFIFWHGPITQVAGHCCVTNPAVIDTFNRHPILSATFHGHEHLYAHVHMDKSRYPNLTHEFEEFITGAAGAGPDKCKVGKANYCQDQTHGFLVVDVSGRNFRVGFFVQGIGPPVRTMNFSKP